MNMIEVNPMLFVKCRLCLSETGQYQIVPNIQMQIKYCFDIDVETFDGLPQLVCKKCESVLSLYTGMKQFFQEKQKYLKTKVITDNITQQQQSSVSIAQVDNDTKNKSRRITKYKRKTKVLTKCSAVKTETCKATRSKDTKIKWQSKYTKYFVCRFCSKSFKVKKFLNTHLHKQCKLYTKYSKKDKSFCLVELNRIGTKSNITGSIDKVVFNKNKIIESEKGSYYIIYTNKSNFFKNLNGNKKRQKQCPVTRRAKKSTIYDQTTAKRYDEENVVVKIRKSLRINSDIKCVNVEDLDSISTNPSVNMDNVDAETPFHDKFNTMQDKMINYIIARCTNKYMNRLTVFDEENTTKCQEEYSLEHKVASIGNTSAVLRSLEQGYLEVIWLPKTDTKIKIKTKSNDNESNLNLGWRDIASFQNHEYVTQDFSLLFDRLSEREACVIKNSEEQLLIPVNLQYQENYIETDSTIAFKRNLEKLKLQKIKKSSYKNTMSSNVTSNVNTTECKVNDNNIYLGNIPNTDKSTTKLLNAYPVANPKKLPKQNFNEASFGIYSNESVVIEQSDDVKDNDMLFVPIHSLKVPLAPFNNTQVDVDYNNKNVIEMNDRKARSTLPKIQCKPMSELMSDNTALTLQNHFFVATTDWVANNGSQSQNIMLQTNDTNMVYMANDQITSIISLQQDHVYYPQNIYPSKSTHKW